MSEWRARVMGAPVGRYAGRMSEKYRQPRDGRNARRRVRDRELYAEKRSAGLAYGWHEEAAVITNQKRSSEAGQPAASNGGRDDYDTSTTPQG